MLIESGQGEGYLARPDLPSHLGFYLDAFWDLANFEGIPFADLDRYASRYGIADVDEFHRFKSLVRRLNNEWASLMRNADKFVETDADEERKPPRGPSPRAVSR